MRISADIIDEEVDSGCQASNEVKKETYPVPNKELERLKDAYICQLIGLTNPMKELEEHFRKKSEERDKQKERNKKRIDEEMSYEDLLRRVFPTDELAPSTRKKEGSFVSTQDVKYKDMCSKFKNLNISGEECLEKMPDDFFKKNFRELAWSFSPDEMEEIKKIQASTTAMTKAKKAKENGAAGKVKESEDDAPPSWLGKYLQKMKQEIKEEILEELKNLPQNEVQGHSASNVKVDENQYQSLFHPGIFCDNCDQLIHGIRYKCGNCADFDLCEECESLPNIHNKRHRFLKIRFPVLTKALKHHHKKPSFILTASNEMHAKGRSSKKLYEANFICDETVPDGTDLPPSTKFIKSWRVLNSGKRVWTHATKLQHIQGSAGLTPASELVDVPHLRPGEEGIVSVLFTTPAVPGIYRSHWNFCHKSCPFGHIVWCHIFVKEPEAEEKHIESNNEALNLPAKGLPSEKEKEVASIAKVLTAVKEEHEKGNIIPRKLAVNSHTATPNNTPFDLTPPKSPDHQAINELKVVVEDKESVPSALPVLEYEQEEDEDSVVSLSSDSDAEFVVIPMPNCFNLSESLVSHNISHLSQYLQSENASDPKDLKLSTQKLLKTQSILNSAFNTETVSQETGVPELSAVQKETEQKILISHNVNADGSSSSEISIIESGDGSPNAEKVVPEISSIHIAVTDDTESDNSEDLDETQGKSPVGKCKAECPDKSSSIQQEIPEKDEPPVDIPGSSATFPKFPVEGITSIYEPASSNTEERTVQVLPEKIVTIPLNVASTVYNATMQAMTNLRRFADIQTVPEGAIGAASSALNPMDQLIEMGFCNRQQNEELLKKHKNDVALVVEELVNLNDNDWYTSRHVPPSAPSI